MPRKSSEDADADVLSSDGGDGCVDMPLAERKKAQSRPKKPAAKQKSTGKREEHAGAICSQIIDVVKNYKIEGADNALPRQSISC